MSICALSSPFEHLSICRGVITFKRVNLVPDTKSALMTLKFWSHEDAIQDNEFDSNVKESRLVK